VELQAGKERATKNMKMNNFFIKTPSLTMCRRYGFDCDDIQTMVKDCFAFEGA
jgi:hypothetical protein